MNGNSAVAMGGACSEQNALNGALLRGTPDAAAPQRFIVVGDRPFKV